MSKSIEELEEEIKQLYKEFFKLGPRDNSAKLYTLHRIAGLKYQVERKKLEGK